MLSHKHKCIFIHIPKTAGMSIERAFIDSLALSFSNGQCPPLLLSYNNNKEVGPRSLAHLLPRDYVRYSYCSEELFTTYFKFTFIRNPWERIVSIYKYFQYHRILTFEKFLIEIFPSLEETHKYFILPQTSYIFDSQGNQLVDFIGRFENLQEDFQKIKQRLCPPLADLPHINKTRRSHNWYSRWNMRFVLNEVLKRPSLIRNIHLFTPVETPYQNYYTPLARNFVYEYYCSDIEKFNYTFE